MKAILVISVLIAVVSAQNSTTTPAAPTAAPSTEAPTAAPTTEAPTAAPTTKAPTAAPTTEAPTAAPTTEAPTEAPTTEPPTPAPTAAPTTEAPTTEEPTKAPGTPPTPPAPEAKQYVVKDGDNICIILNFAGEFVIPYVNIKNTTVTAHLNIKNATVDSTGSYCSKNGTKDQAITLVWGQNSVSMKFVKDTDKKKVYVSNITLSYFTDPVTFPGHQGKPNTYTVSAVNKTEFSSSFERSYKCKAETDIEFPNKIVLSVTNAQAEAFRDQTNDKFSLAEVCSKDDKTSNIVPIAVGCALAALVLIVLIAYCIGRRRSRQKGYQSV